MVPLLPKLSQKLKGGKNCLVIFVQNKLKQDLSASGIKNCRACKIVEDFQ
jgi:hypothetical protein